MKCPVDGCGKKHHTMLYLESPHQATGNSTIPHILHVKPVTVIYGGNTRVVNTLLDSYSDTTLITPELGKNSNTKRETTKAKHQ